MPHIVLLPDNAGGQSIALILGHPWNCGGVFPIKPMSLIGIDLDQVHVAIWVGLTQLGQLVFSFAGDLIPIVGAVEPAHVDRKGDVRSDRGRLLGWKAALAAAQNNLPCGASW